jgi:flagellar protein FlaG
MANEISISTPGSSYYPNAARLKINEEATDPVVQSAVQFSNQAVLNIQTSVELKKAELSGSPLTVGEEQLVKTIERANKALEGRSTSFEFSIHKQTKQISIKVIDKDTGEVIREIPPEKTLDMVAKMWEMAGLLVDERR